MHNNLFLNIFQQAASRLEIRNITRNEFEIEVGIFERSVFLKLYKSRWRNKSSETNKIRPGIFFSVWVNDKILKEKKLYYNIHALKLRDLNGYSLTSRDFAYRFRTVFTNLEQEWENISLQFGPQTLMQGWVSADINSLQDQIIALSMKFKEISYLIDELLEGYKK